ncbi:zinc knuckle, partial [Ancylostoma duodenale]
MSVEELNEEMLLQWPEKDATSEVPMDENEDVHGIATDQKVANKSITTVVAECDKALSRSFRTTDPIRNEVMESVERQAKVAKETTKISLEQFIGEWEEIVQSILIGKRSDIEDGVIEILQVANLTQTHQLELCLDERIADRETIQALGDIELTSRIGQLGQQPLMGIAPNDGYKGHFNFGGLESYDLHMLIAIARKKLQRDKGSAHVFVGHRKRALVTFETLPKDVREGSFEEVVAAMQACLQEDGNSARIKALHQLRNLSLRNDQSVGEFCVVLEKIAHRAFPDTPAEVVSLQKAEILFRQLASWNGSYSLSEAIEMSKSGEAYENVKKAALRLERNRKAVQEMSQGSACEVTPKYQLGQAGYNRFERFNNINGDNDGSTSNIHPSSRLEAKKHHRMDIHGREVTQPKPHRTAVDRAVVECYSCGKQGHMAKDCRVRSARRNKENTRPSSTNDRQASSFSALVDKLVGSTTMSKDCWYNTKQRYDRRNKVDPPKIRRAGGRVNMKQKVVENKFKHFELAGHCRGPARLPQFGKNYASLANVLKAKDKSTQCDMLVEPTREFDNNPGRTKTKRATAKRDRKAFKARDAPQIFACCRVTTSRDPAVSDNSALGLFSTGPIRKTVILAPSGFRGYERLLKTKEGVDIIIYRDLKDVINAVGTVEGMHTCISLTPTSEKPYDAKKWQTLAVALTSLVRLGTKLLAVSSPRGEAAWSTHRKNTLDMFNIIRQSAAAMRRNVVTMFSPVPSLNEPFACLGEDNRSTENSVYPAQAIRAFMKTLQGHVAPHIKGGLYQLLDQPLSREDAYRLKKRAHNAESNHICRNFQPDASDENQNHYGYTGPVRRMKTHRSRDCREEFVH